MIVYNIVESVFLLALFKNLGIVTMFLKKFNSLIYNLFVKKIIPIDFTIWSGKLDHIALISKRVQNKIIFSRLDYFSSYKDCSATFSIFFQFH